MEFGQLDHVSVLLLEAADAIDALSKMEKTTNSDCIRAMTDEELAELISSDWCEIICSPNTNCQYEDCRGKILGWLKQEAAEGE